MLTFEKVLDVFREYLIQDEMYEVIMTPHGYALLEWDFRCEDWTDIKRCATPEIMLEILLDKYTGYLEYQSADGNGNVPDHAKAEIEVKRQTLIEKLQ